MFRLTLSCLSVFALIAMATLAAEPPVALEDGAGRVAPAADSNAVETPAERGYRLLRTKSYLPADFSDEIFNDLWTVWPKDQRAAAEKLTSEERRKATFEYYGLTESPAEEAGKFGHTAMGYVADGRGGWVMNCLSCHGGKVAGKTYPGLPNSHFALQSLTADVGGVKLRKGIPWGHMELGSLAIPLGASNGTTNAVVFGVAFGATRDLDANVVRGRKSPEFVHHDMDAPPWWNVKKKKKLYIDGFAPKNGRVLIQFVLLPKNTGEIIRGWERDFDDLLAWIETVEAPKYPFAIDQELAAKGKPIFGRKCSECHGTYGASDKDDVYPEVTVPIDDLRTDPVRLSAIPSAHREEFGKSWFVHYGKTEADQVTTHPEGYVAPPLDGIWASAPYLHNGSVPTLWALFHPEQRPKIWKRTEDGYDQGRVGLEIETFESLPAGLAGPERRRYFDTRLKGKRAAGHDYPAALSEDEKSAVIEYMKTL